jgi:hypothetical protein
MPPKENSLAKWPERMRSAIALAMDIRTYSGLSKAGEAVVVLVGG